MEGKARARRSTSAQHVPLEQPKWRCSRSQSGTAEPKVAMMMILQGPLGLREERTPAGSVPLTRCRSRARA